MTSDTPCNLWDLLLLRCSVRQSDDELFSKCLSMFSPQQLKHMILCYLDNLRTENKIMSFRNKKMKKKSPKFDCGIRVLPDIDIEILGIFDANITKTMKKHKIKQIKKHNKKMKQMHIFNLPNICMAIIYNFLDASYAKESFKLICTNFYEISHLIVSKNRLTLDLAKFIHFVFYYFLLFVVIRGLTFVFHLSLKCCHFLFLLTFFLRLRQATTQATKRSKHINKHTHTQTHINKKKGCSVYDLQ